ncbi:energy transducer TonB [Mucilaginibacter sp. HD30]
MRTLKNALKIAVAIMAATSFSANAMHADYCIKKQVVTHMSMGIDTTIYTSVDVAPYFPGGVTALMDYLTGSIKYPAEDREKKVTGKVFVVFVVEPDGSLSNCKAMRGPSETLKAEATRVLANSPKWQAGQLGGKKVRVRYTIPINFELPK